MRINRKPAEPDWQFDGTTLTVRVPMTFARRSGRKVIIAPDGSDAWLPMKPRPDETLIRRWRARIGGSGCWRRGGIGRLQRSPKPKA